MNWLDYVLIFVIILNLYNGFKEGFARQVMGLASFFVALYFSLCWSGTINGYLQDRLNLGRIIGALSRDEVVATWLADMLLNLLAFIFVFFAVAFLLKLITRKLKILNEVPVIGPLNIFLGAVLGIVKGLLVTFLIVSLISLIEIPFWGNTVEASVIVALSQHYLAFLYNLIYHYIVGNLGQLV